MDSKRSARLRSREARFLAICSAWVACRLHQRTKGVILDDRGVCLDVYGPRSRQRVGRLPLPPLRRHSVSETHAEFPTGTSNPGRPEIRVRGLRNSTLRLGRFRLLGRAMQHDMWGLIRAIKHRFWFSWDFPQVCLFIVQALTGLSNL